MVNVFKKILGKNYYLLRKISNPFREPHDLEKYDAKFVKKVYMENLKLALKEVKKCVERLPKKEKTIITADHGEFLGDYGIYGHPHKDPYKDFSTLRVVPWLEIG